MFKYLSEGELIHTNEEIRNRGESVWIQTDKNINELSGKGSVGSNGTPSSFNDTVNENGSTNTQELNDSKKKRKKMLPWMILNLLKL